MGKNKNKHSHIHESCCGGHGSHCACEARARGVITDEAQLTLQLVNLIMAQGKKTSQKEKILYNDLMADADLTNI